MVSMNFSFCYGDFIASEVAPALVSDFVVSDDQINPLLQSHNAQGQPEGLAGWVLAELMDWQARNVVERL